MINFGDFLNTWNLGSNIVTRMVNLNKTKLEENAKIEKLNWDILGDFQTMWNVFFLYFQK